MNTDLLLISITCTLTIFCFGLYLLFISERGKNLVLQGKLNPFKRRGHFLTGAEKVLFSILKSDQTLIDYEVFPQLHLSTLLDVKDEAFDIQGKFDWLNKLYVDFVLFDKQTLEPKLVIELNDATHLWNSRRARDEFIANALEENKIPLLPISTNMLVKPTEIMRMVQEKFNGNDGGEKRKPLLKFYTSANILHSNKTKDQRVSKNS